MLQQLARSVIDSRAEPRRQLAGGSAWFARHLKPIFGGMAALLMLSCSEESSRSPTPAAEAGASSQGEAGASSQGGSSTQGEAGSPSQGASENPKTIYEMLDHINALPHPVELSHLLESLNRPLSLNANSNTQSAQPAVGKRSPRIFLILNDTLSMSFVPGADPTLEFGERNAGDPGFSVKAEVHFPIEDQLAPEDAFTRLAPDAATGRTLEDATRCGVCHDNEKPTADYPFLGAFTSAIVKPSTFFAVDVASIRQERETCDASAEPERCAVLQALFDHGDVVQKAFP
jgi:hypothetical protein